MDLTRRSLIAQAGLWPLIADAAGDAETEALSLPVKDHFPVYKAETCLNNARWHPLSSGAMGAVQEYLNYKAAGGALSGDYSFAGELQRDVKRLFAELIHARPSEISFVPSTTVGENLIVSALGIPASRGNVVTDALHFEGSLYHYGALARQGLDVRIVKPRDWRIELRDLEKVVNRNTRLIAVSLVSMINGFQHDLKAVCDLAHAHSAYVFADIVQAAGAVPIDVRASGGDFCFCARYKWLMGDVGLGFLYVREDLLDRVRRPQYGYRQLSEMEYHMFPYDAPGKSIFEWKQTTGAGAYFEVGTVANATVACLNYSLRFIQKLGVEKI